ncbi:hypothetical protein LV457_13820 [Mycobacterium sp. MYCO198283]|uniref:hypothetical protein n=1 Tax=Mycobacterium sp. MYCO198283 TaxID=2883505 RepID=UPI001E6066D9|nr:hypothetical protein [Mycobacterium sp. MYCO198283]MCG5433355.1 hypothetical protein [Mycobacterium sp. MYCO198283]
MPDPSAAAPLSGCFVAEWYRPQLSRPGFDSLVALLDSAAAALEAGGAVRLLVAFVVPADDTVYGVFAADTGQRVLQMCSRAGVLPQRITPDTHVDVRPVAS